MAAKPGQKRVIPINSLYVAEPKIYPKSISGRFQRWRWLFVWLTQAVFYGFCWLPWNGRQAVLFDLDTRRFDIFGLSLRPQDTIYLAILLILSALALFLFTAVAGRLWCGYTCPQTVYTEIFLWIEARIEGDRSQRMKLDAAPWSIDKLRRKTAKHFTWIAFSLWTGLTFVGYFTPIRPLTEAIANASVSAWEAFWILFYAAATYGNAGFFREQMCKYVCPYARFQFVMFDADTLIITYDEARGEPRGRINKTQSGAEAPRGDCIDCGICVQVCPTGIDIRDGLQAECIACAACIDACDQVMDKIERPRGLIRYATENAVVRKLGRQDIVRRALRPRTAIYAAIFTALMLGTSWSLAHRADVQLAVQRDRGGLYRETEDGIENSYQITIANTAETTRTLTLSVEGLNAARIIGRTRFVLPPAGTAVESIAVRINGDRIGSLHGAQPIRFRLQTLDGTTESIEQKASLWLP